MRSAVKKLPVLKIMSAHNLSVDDSWTSWQTEMKKILIIMSICMVINQQTQAQQPLVSSTKTIPALPDSLGFAGMYAGVVMDELIAAGGANFPDKMPWDGGKKIWYDHIYVYSKKQASWKLIDLKLPKGLAYGASVSYKEGLILFGGSSENNIPSSQVIYLYKKQDQWSIMELTQMPLPMVNMCAQKIGNDVLLMGGSDQIDSQPVQAVLAFDITRNIWKKLPAIPASARINAVSATLEGKCYVFSGIALEKLEDGSFDRQILHDAYCFTPVYIEGRLQSGRWEKLADVPQGIAAGPSSAATLGTDEILFFGGLDEQTARHVDPRTHPGFLPNVLCYNITTDSWSIKGQLQKEEIRLTLPGIQDGDLYHLISGEIGPGVRTNTILSIDLKKLKNN